MLILRRFRTLTAVLAVAALVALNGCGGGDDKSKGANAAAQTTATTPGSSSTAPGSSTTVPGSNSAAVKPYADAFDKVAETFNQAVQAATVRIQAGATAGEKLKGITALKAAVSDAAEEFSALNPPPIVKAEHGELVSGLRAFARDIAVIERSAQTGDASAAAQANQRIQKRQTDIQAALAGIKAKVGA
jgi:hypothetical protein